MRSVKPSVTPVPSVQGNYSCFFLKGCDPTVKCKEQNFSVLQISFLFSYSHDIELHNGRCYNYGCQKLTSGLNEVSNYDAVQSRWMAASGEMEGIGGVKGVKNSHSAHCYKKLYPGIHFFFYNNRMTCFFFVFFFGGGVVSIQVFVYFL